MRAATSTSPFRIPRSYPGVARDATDDVFLADLAEGAGSMAHLAQEAANEWQVPNDEPRRQPAFLSQIITEPLEYLV
ncbi:hypothetical protein E3H11_36070 [Bradyrhizobium brasilense]|uniref:hypothetical protein n=1 Tax=Bradyrhizobium brasilense TaxID=1419277 RepID=UPI0014565327|nr:hypothetical protein [Bradyrhizobium brasilense]NLS74219.1 hypothetical protein [Bradyrhizobium brasilense]